MIKAVVVDDERLVRKGFISLIDWSSFGIVIVGDAADGKSALELLEQVEPDLLFTDITMPGMSGFELIKQVRVRFPRIRSVVLTCHHEFDYVQEALRLGAIDYIVKTLLEPDSADEVIGRIVDRIGWEANSRGSFAQEEQKERVPTKTAILLSPAAPDANANELFQLQAVRRNSLVQMGDLWMIPLIHPIPEPELVRDLAISLNKRWHTAMVTDLAERPLEEVKSVFETKLANELFYMPYSDRLLQLSYTELRLRPDARQMSIDELNNEGRDLKWTLCVPDFEAFIRKVEQGRPEAKQLADFGEEICRVWSGLLMKPPEAELLSAEIAANRSWQDWKIWLRRFSDHAQRRMFELSFSKEVMYCLIRAVRFMRNQANGKLTQTDVADYVKMSRSYFSQCFSRFAGEPFGVMLRGMRIEKAKTLLAETDTPVYEIASIIGFEDEKYFSKLFREVVGLLPTEYRSTALTAKA